MSQGSINLTDEAFASQRMTAPSPITSNRGMHALQSRRAGIETNSQLVGYTETIQKTGISEATTCGRSKTQTETVSEEPAIFDDRIHYRV
jgi:hypothetical protein